MKNKQTKTKFESLLGFAGYLLSRVVCLGAIILICSSAPAQNLFVAVDAPDAIIYELTPTGVRTTFASGIAGALAFDNAGNLFVASDNIYKFTPDGVRTIFASGYFDSLAFDSAGNLFVAVCDFDSNEFPINGSGKVYKFTPDGSQTTFASGLDFLFAMTCDSAGNLSVANVSTLGKDQGISGAILRFTPGGVRSTFASGLLDPDGLAFDTKGNLFVADPFAGSIYEFTPAGARTTFASGLNFPEDLAFDGAGNLFTADSPAHAIYKFTPGGMRSTFAATDGFNRIAFQPTLTSDPGQLQNISTRGFAQTGDNVMIGGFVITGTEPKKVILRAIGPSLASANPPVADALADPVLELHEPDGTVITNDNWKDTQEAEIIASTISPTKDLESAIVATLNPGAYTAIVSGKNGGTGVALVEAYDLDQAAASQLANISTRGFVETGDNVMIGGFIVGGGGGGSASVIVRAIGPSLASATPPVQGALADPMLELHDGNGTLLASNDNWKDTQQAQIQATGLAPTNDAESATVQTLAPGNYTVILRGKNNTIGVALVEVYGLN